MSRVLFTIEEEELDGDYGVCVPGLIVTCSRCGHSVEVFGTEEASVKRGAVMLREECPRGDKNFYVKTETGVGIW
jgi:hypothetical protein